MEGVKRRSVRDICTSGIRYWDCSVPGHQRPKRRPVHEQPLCRVLLATLTEERWRRQVMETKPAAPGPPPRKEFPWLKGRRPNQNRAMLTNRTPRGHAERSLPRRGGAHHLICDAGQVIEGEGLFENRTTGLAEEDSGIRGSGISRRDDQAT